MRRTDLLKLAACAAGSFVMSVAILSPPRLDATSPSTMPVTPIVDAAALKIDGIELSVRYIGSSTSERAIMVETGTPLEMELVAQNTADHAGNVPVSISMSGTDASNPLSRVIRYKELWRHDETIALAPGESRTIELPTGIKIANGQSMMINLTSGKEAVSALHLAAPLKFPLTATAPQVVAANKPASGS